MAIQAADRSGLRRRSALAEGDVLIVAVHDPFASVGYFGEIEASINGNPSRVALSRA